MAAVFEVVAKLLAAKPIESSGLQCEHNHIRRESHLGETLWVHRKGAIRAGEGEPGIIPGSMGTASYLVEGRGCPESLQSSSHGSGRS